MPLVLDEQQRLLRDSARSFFTDNAPVSALRRLRDERDPVGYAPDLWRRMAQLGWASIILPEEYGGLQFGFTGLGLVLEESGRTLAASPLFATGVLGASAVLLGGSDTRKQALLPPLARGELTLALALEESHQHRPTRVATRAETRQGGHVINGCKSFVLDGHTADKLIVVARTAGADTDTAGLTLLLVDRNAPGVAVQRTVMVDSRNAANISFCDGHVGADAV